MNHRKWWAIAAIIWMTAIFFFTQLPYFTGEKTSEVIQKVVVAEQKTINKTPSTDHTDINKLNLIVRKATHIVVFGILAILLYKALETNRFAYILSWTLTVLYAITDEWHQSFMPGRVAAYQDVLFDSVGALVALFILVLIRNNYKLVKNIRT
ncbi:VanZ family protein [Neobacillus niacini]|uniref:VanZ family protein n=1 Tax=Neobacillus driksii TaxID=3035913 RepID=UPI00278A2698|nr:VanZ family protein [Neobacillus niacini]MDQ0974616.1 VanZ family protein [Neobacillus niacini]